MVMAIDVNEQGMKYTIEEVEKATHSIGIREVDKKEFNKLAKEYQGE